MPNIRTNKTTSKKKARQEIHPRIALLHSETRSYRVPLFDKLNSAYDIDFYFMYGGGWSKQYPESKNWNYQDMKPIPMIGYSGDFSLGIIFHLFKNYDIIITSGLASFATHISFLIAKLTGKKIILWDEIWEWPTTIAAKIARPYAKFIVQHADACIAAGTKAQDFYLSFGADPSKVFIANNCAVDMKKRKTRVEIIEQLRTKYNLAGKKVILYLGRIIKYKGLDYLLRAFAHIEKNNPDAFLLICGEDFGLETYCKKLAQQLKLTNYLFSGNIAHETVQEHYLLADVFVLPTRFLYEDNIINESWGLTVNEALSLGIPVVATTAVAAAYDMISDGVCGYLVEEQNITELQKAIENTLLHNPKMKIAARKAFEDWNNYTTMFNGFKTAIEHALK